LRKVIKYTQSCHEFSIVDQVIFFFSQAPDLAFFLKKMDTKQASVVPVVPVVTTLSIPGLYNVLDLLTKEEETALWKIINENKWDHTLARRTQHFGKRYVYNTNQKDMDPVPPVPDWAFDLFKKAVGSLQKQNLGLDCPREKLQVIVNEYAPGQGIGKHIDSTREFGPWVITISLGSPVVMIFENGFKTDQELLQPRSLYVMTGDSRYKWTHKIDHRKTDVIDGKVCLRTTRISVTFRRLL